MCNKKTILVGRNKNVTSHSWASSYSSKMCKSDVVSVSYANDERVILVAELGAGHVDPLQEQL